MNENRKAAASAKETLAQRLLCVLALMTEMLFELLMLYQKDKFGMNWHNLMNCYFPKKWYSSITNKGHQAEKGINIMVKTGFILDRMYA